MKLRTPPRHAARLSIAALAALASHSLPARAGQDANFVTYNHHMEEKGAVEVQINSDYSRVGDGEPNYTAQLIEVEYGVTELYSTALYLEGAKTFEDGESYEFGSFRWENRVRLFAQETLFNPVLYAEYELERPGSRYKRAVTGRVEDEDEEEEEEGTEHELETKLIIGHDISGRLNVAFNTIHTLDLLSGDWSFGYAAGLNYALYRSFDGDSEFGGGSGLNKLTLGLEMFGGLGDSVEGLTLDSDETEQYAGVSLRADFLNNTFVAVGGAFGLTEHSEDALVRVKAGIEFE